MSDAADALFTSQPGISKQIRQLEDELGLSVFVRQGKRLASLTPAGEIVVATARRAMREVANLKRVADEYRGEAAKAFIKLRAGSAAFSLDELKAFLAGKLGRHEIPAALAFVDELPRTPVGKLSRHELRSQQAKSQPAQEKIHKLATGGRP